jgi:GMP synthase-like glutamine amidotransferase
VRATVAARTPVFGICFGGQVLARVLGGNVSRSPQPEIGWRSIASHEPSFVPHGPWMEFHYDRFTLPEGGIAIARTSRALQAFTFGPHFGVQFHPEISPAVFDRWMTECVATGEIDELRAMGIDLDRIGEEVAANANEARAQGMRLFDAFFERAQRIGRTRALALRGA